MPPTWLLVWTGDGVGAAEITAAVGAVGTSDDQAHDFYFTEEVGPRKALLLVHWSAGERDQVLQMLEPYWDFCFVNEVHDLGGLS